MAALPALSLYFSLSLDFWCGRISAKDSLGLTHGVDDTMTHPKICHWHSVSTCAASDLQHSSMSLSSASLYYCIKLHSEPDHEKSLQETAVLWIVFIQSEVALMWFSVQEQVFRRLLLMSVAMQYTFAHCVRLVWCLLLYKLCLLVIYINLKAPVLN